MSATEAAPQPAVTVEPLTSNLCDRCPALAKFRIVSPLSSLDLVLCGHHYTENSKFFEAWTISPLEVQT